MGRGEALFGPKLLRQLGNELVIFALRPCPHGAGAHIAQRADLHAELGDVVAARRLDDADQIELAVGQVGLLDFNTELFGDFARLGGALGRVFNVAKFPVRSSSWR
jgi:hypothetical protein